MRKFAFVASAALIAAAFGGWMSTTTTALVAPPANGAGIDPIQIMVGSPNSAYPALRRLFVHLSEQLIAYFAALMASPGPLLTAAGTAQAIASPSIVQISLQARMPCTNRSD